LGDDMSHEINLSKYKIRTDLLVETIDTDTLAPYESVVDGIKVTDITIDDEMSTKIGKKPGRYFTISFDDITDFNNKEKVKKVFANTFNKLIKDINTDGKILIIGLGNDKSTPDSLGPLVIDNILVTEPLFEFGSVEEGFKRVAAFSPGVFGQTGIETSEAIISIANTYKPSLIITIDALASQALERVNHTIQMTNTGITPGSGVGNHRAEISKETMGIPVIAIGVPTVVDAVTIVSDTINYMYKHYSYSKKNINNPANKLIIGGINYLKKDVVVKESDKSALFGLVGTLDESEVKSLLFEVLSPIGYNLMVTPKEVDFIIEKLADIIGNGLNDALHKKVDNL
jgi:spore protease